MALIGLCFALLSLQLQLQLQLQLYSVKWYKNYVEFYRFQPLQAYYSSSSDQSQAGDNQQQHSKQEFELDGISLNVSNEARSCLLQSTNSGL